MAKAKRSLKPQESTSARRAPAHPRRVPTEYVNLWADNSDDSRDRFEALKDYVERTVRPLLGLKTIQVLLLREALDYLVLRTEDTREINDVVTPSSRSGQPELRRVAFLGGKQKAVESRELERLLREVAAETGFDQLAYQGGDDCFLKKLCLRCPRCGLFGATSTESGKGQKPNIKHRIEYSTALSFLPYEEVVEEMTFNAISDKQQITDTALNSRPCVRPGTLFVSIVTLRCVTPQELLLALKVLLSARSYGAESRIQGDVRNHVIGIVAGWEEVLTPLELTLEFEKNLDEVVKEGSRPAAVKSAVETYFPLSAYPEKVLLLNGGQISVEPAGDSTTGGGGASAPTSRPMRLRVRGGLDELLDAVRDFRFSNGFMEGAYKDVAGLRQEQGDDSETGASAESSASETPETPAGSGD